MAQEIEIEFKNLLSKDEYELLLDRMPFPEEGQKQVNYYFETPDFHLREHQSALRIREKNGGFNLTLKEPFGDGLLETHDGLTGEEAHKWICGNPVAKELTEKQLGNMGIEISELKYFGDLTTIRREYKQDSLIFVLDQNFYNEYEDYELEIEATSKEAGLKALQTLLYDWNITKKQTPNKIARFFNTLP